MSKSTNFLRDALLIDTEGNRSKIIQVRGHEAGLDHLEIHTQSPFERENHIKTVHRIFSEECEAHIESEKCWCHPTVEQFPTADAQVFIHNEARDPYDYRTDPCNQPENIR